MRGHGCFHVFQLPHWKFRCVFVVFPGRLMSSNIQFMQVDTIEVVVFFFFLGGGGVKVL